MQQFILVLFALLALSNASSKRQNSNSGITVPLYKRANHRPVRTGLLSDEELASKLPTTNLDALEAARDALIDKYVEGSAAKRRLAQKRAQRDVEHKREEQRRREKRVVQDVAMTNHNFDIVYSANIQLGSPSQRFRVLLDTGSSDTWVTASDCRCVTSGCTSCVSGSSWNPTQSSTYSQRGKVLSISYGSGSVSGYTGQDVVTLGGFTIADQVIGVVNSSGTVLPGDVEGLMGLAFGSIARGGGTPWWLRILAGEAGQTVDSPMISFWLSRYIDTTEKEVPNHPGGQFIIGGTNSTLYTGDITYSDVIQPAKWWLINLESVGKDGADSIPVEIGAQQSIIDTGTTLIGGQDVVVNAILGNVEGAIKGEQVASKMRGFYALPCNATTAISFTFSGQSYIMSTRDLLYMRIDDLRPNYCLCSLFTYSSADRHSIDYRPLNQPYWLIGAAFLKNVYSVFTLGDSAGDGTPAGIQGMGNTGTTAKVGFARLSEVSGEVGLAVDGNAGSSSSSASASATGSTNTTRTVEAQTGRPLGLIPDVMTTIVVVTATDDGTTPSASGSPNDAARSSVVSLVSLGVLGAVMGLL